MGTLNVINHTPRSPNCADASSERAVLLFIYLMLTLPIGIASLLRGPAYPAISGIVGPTLCCLTPPASHRLLTTAHLWPRRTNDYGQL
jgi:hypothetical protein